ncbi:MAG: PaaI family thioesterase [Sphingomonadales bacterium]|nr:MAG: PaaI family thioesterase [Sphingomonadales bacterium]
MTDAPIRNFDPEALFVHRFRGHGDTLGIAYHAHGPDWAELALPYDARLIGDPASGVIASGPILALMDMATSVAVWLKLDAFMAHATLDLRIDYLRPARPGQTVIGRGECYRLTRSIAFVRGQAHDGDPADPLANVAGTFMATEGYW